MTAPDDPALWARAVDGDAEAFGVLFDRHADAVYNHCFRLTGSWAMAEDAVQATFLQAWRVRARIRLVAATARPWLLAVAGNVVRNEHRGLGRRRRLAARVGRPEIVPDPADAVADRLDDERRMAAVLRAVGQLPPAEREAVALCLWSAVSYGEAAAVLGIAESSVRARVSRARRRLRAELGEPAEPEATSEVR